MAALLNDYGFLIVTMILAATLALSFISR